MALNHPALARRPAYLLPVPRGWKRFKESFQRENLAVKSRLKRDVRTKYQETPRKDKESLTSE